MIDRRINAGERQDAMLRALTDAELAAMTMTEAELLAMAPPHRPINVYRFNMATVR